jgi:threonine dehydratase
LAEDAKLVVEGAGAAALAAVLGAKRRFKGRRVGLVISGGNIDSRLLTTVLLRALVGSGRIIRLRIDLADTPGTLARVSALIGEAGGNIVELTHQRMFSDVPPRQAELDVMIETRDPAHAGAIVAALNTAGYRSRRRTDTESPPARSRRRSGKSAKFH